MTAAWVRAVAGGRVRERKLRGDIIRCLKWPNSGLLLFADYRGIPVFNSHQNWTAESTLAWWIRISWRAARCVPCFQEAFATLLNRPPMPPFRTGSLEEEESDRERRIDGIDGWDVSVEE